MSAGSHEPAELKSPQRQENLGETVEESPINLDVK